MGEGHSRKKHSSRPMLRGGKACGSPAWLKHMVRGRSYGLPARKGELEIKPGISNVRLRFWTRRKGNWCCGLSQINQMKQRNSCFQKFIWMDKSLFSFSLSIWGYCASKVQYNGKKTTTWARQICIHIMILLWLSSGPLEPASLCSWYDLAHLLSYKKHHIALFVQVKLNLPLDLH